MNYQWNPACLTRVFALPAAVVDSHIRLAGSAQLKVLLWLACHGEGTFDSAACSAAIGLSAADCSDALQYWLACGLLQPAGEYAPAPAAPQPAAPEQPPRVPQPVETAPPSPPPAKPAPAPRPKAVKPTVKEVVQRQKDCPEFAYLLDTTSARLGRPISHGDMETLLYLYETAGLPIEVILMVVGYAVTAGKLNMRYIEKVALDWADRGIDSLAAAEEYLCALEKRDAAALRVKNLLHLERSFTVGQMEQVEKWVCLWKLPDGLIQLAARVCQEKTGKFNCSYVDRILEGWHEQGIDTAEKAEALLQKSKAKGAPAVEHSSLDLDEYEQRVADFVPVYRKKDS